MILRALEGLTGRIIGEYNLKIQGWSCVDYETERKLKEMLVKLVMNNNEEGLTINRKKMYGSQQKNQPKEWVIRLVQK